MGSYHIILNDMVLSIFSRFFLPVGFCKPSKLTSAQGAGGDKSRYNDAGLGLGVAG